MEDIDNHISELRHAAAKLNTFVESGGYIKACRQISEASAIEAALLQIAQYINQMYLTPKNCESSDQTRKIHQG